MLSRSSLFRLALRQPWPAGIHPPAVAPESALQF